MAHRPRYPMPVSQRARIFAPFDALKGFSAALREKEKIILPRRILEEDKLAELNKTALSLDIGSPVTVVYYKDGAYLTLSGNITDIDPINRTYAISDTEIDFEDIYELKTAKPQ